MANIVEIIIKGTDQASKTFQGIGEGLSSIGPKVTDAGKSLSTKLTLPLIGVAAGAVFAASEFEESFNKVQVVFGDSTTAIVDFSETASTSLGLSQEQALGAAGTFGNLFTAMGIGVETSAGMSEELLTLAADLASFNNIDPTMALDKLRAGLVGEVEPLRTLGVNLTAATIKSKALEMGLISEGDELDAAAKAQASFALIMEQTTTAQGDFARTSDGLANSMRIVKAQLGDAAAELGAVLLPIVTEVVDVFRDLLDRFMELTPEQQKWIVILGGIAAAIGPVLMIVGTLATAIGAIIPIVGAVVGILTGPVGIAIAVVVAAVALLALAWKNNWLGIRDIVAKAIEFIKPIIENAMEFIKKVIDNALIFINTIVDAFRAAFSGNWREFGEKLREAWDMAWEAITTILLTIRDKIGEIIRGLVSKIIEIITTTDWKELGIKIISGIVGGIKSMAQSLANTAKDVAQGAVDAVKGFLGIQSPSKLMMEIGHNINQGLASGLRNTAQIPAAVMVQTSRGAMDAFTPQPSFAGEEMGRAGATQIFNFYPSDAIDVEEMVEQVAQRVAES